VHLSPKNGEYPNNVVLNLIIDDGETKSNHLHLLDLSMLQLEVPYWMPNVKELEDLMDWSLW